MKKYLVTFLSHHGTIDMNMRVIFSFSKISVMTHGSMKQLILQKVHLPPFTHILLYYFNATNAKLNFNLA
jgi:hypothetical protein